MSPRYHSRFRLALPAALLLALAGCKETLYSDLGETAANEMVAVLSMAEIKASRERDKDNRYTILVSGDDVAAATIELRNAGLPRSDFQSLGDIFSASGIIGTPFEQHARYIHALNQEIGGMLTEIEGVDVAKVIVNAPEASGYRRDTPDATAAVTIHHDTGFSTEASLAQIKQLVSHSVPNLPYENVSVAFFPRTALIVERIDASAQTEAAASGSDVTAADVVGPALRGVSKNPMMLAVACGLLALALFVFALLPSITPTRPRKPRADPDMSGRS